MKKLYFLIITVTLIIAACAKKVEPLTGEPGGQLVIGTTDLPNTVSPLAPSIFGSNEILDLLFMRLHRIDPQTGKMIPELASSWEFSEDLTSITYYLRRDIKWWDGEPVTTEDVLYTFEKMKDPSTNYPDIASLRFIKDVKVLSTYAIKFSFTKVYSDILTDSDIMPVPKHIYEKIGNDFGKNPVGNGPYKIKEWIPGTQLILTYNGLYYRGRPPLDEILINYYANRNDMIKDLTDGDLDLVLAISPSAAKNLSANKNIAINSKTGNAYTYIGWNLNNDLLKDKEIRRALSMAINKAAILNDVFGGLGTVSLGPLPPSSWGFNGDIKPIEYNLVKAKQILQQKGFEDRNGNKIFDMNGRDITLDIITNRENPERVDILNGVVRDLKLLGVNVNAETLDAISFVEAIVNKNFDGFIMGWRVDEKIDPTIYWYSDPAKGKLNFIGYKNRIIDSLIDLGVSMINRKKAKDIWGQFQKIIYEDNPCTFLIVPNNISANYKRLKGAEQGVVLARAYAYWIPKVERRIAVATLLEPQKPTLPPGKPAKPPQVIEPEKLLEAAAKKETTTIAVVPETLPVVPPKPSVITKAVPTKQVKPKYPESARSLGAKGVVLVRILVDTNGKAKNAVILQSFGNPACEVAALAAARQWEFKPATKDGVPFEQNISIPFDFEP